MKGRVHIRLNRTEAQIVVERPHRPCAFGDIALNQDQCMSQDASLATANRAQALRSANDLFV